jgi:metallo-beta-lactamase family protein
MKLSFWGAAGVVTGSMHQLSVDGKEYLLDCGMYQGRRKEAEKQNRQFPFPANSIEAVILSHAHIDHSGNLPLLVKNGFHNPIYATSATADLCGAMLRDTGKILEQDARFLNKRRREGEPLTEPLFTIADAEKTLPLFTTVPYYKPTNVAPGLKYTAYDAGHMLGSSSLLIEGNGVRLCFSGDVGRPGLPIIRDPDTMPPADYLIMESTYGDRLHEDEQTVIGKLCDVVNRTVDRGGRVIVPAFAVGRVQQLVLLLHQLSNEGRIPKVLMFVDSPLAVDVTKVFREHSECFDEETKAYLKEGDPFGFGQLRYVRETEESKKLNSLSGPFVVISPSGMCEAGRVLHHLANNIEDERNTVLITGYQAEHTLGRKMLQGLDRVNILGNSYQLRAKVESLQALSGHADRDELLAWMKPIVPTLKKVFLVHGEDDQPQKLAETIQRVYHVETVVAQRGTSFEL